MDGFEGNFDLLGTPIKPEEYVTIIGPEGATLLRAFKTLTREEVLLALGDTIHQAGQIPIIEGFCLPVKNTEKAWYEAAHHFKPYNLHPEYCWDWNLESMGNTDLGEPLVAPMNGIVTGAQNYGGNWGKIVQIVGMKITDDFKVTFYIWMGAHLDEVYVQEGQIVSMGQEIGTIGTGEGKYAAHLHEQWAKGPSIPRPTEFPSNKNYHWINPSEVYLQSMTEEELNKYLYLDKK